LSKAERKSIISILAIYLTSTILLVATLAFNYYHYKKEQIQEKEQTIMNQNSKSVLFKIQNLHNNKTVDIIYPRFKEFNSAIFDIERNLIFSTLEKQDIDFDKKFYHKDDYIYYIEETTPYYLGTAYIVIEMKNKGMISSVSNNLVILTLIIIFIITITSLFLVKLILKPIRDNLKLMDRFIKDTTHELNTPISTILTNIELIDSTKLDIKVEKKFNRIKTASLTISNIYEDLAFLILKHTVSSQNELLNINNIIRQRVEYFNILFKSKNITVDIDEKDTLFLNIDNKKVTRIIDNLISNAIKYTKKQTHIQINIDENSFQICDQGYGMSKEQISKVFERYSRFDNTQGGFGIGYNIIYTIINEYNLNIKIDSKLNEGTCVTLSK